MSAPVPAFAATITASPSSTPGTVRLYHGTMREHAIWIANHGLDAARALAGGGEGYFWCAAEVSQASKFAIWTLCSSPTVLAFDLEESVVENCLSSGETVPWLRILEVGTYTHYKFDAPSFKLLNASINGYTLLDASAVDGNQG